MAEQHEPSDTRDLGLLEGLILVPDWAALERADYELASSFNQHKFDYLEDRSVMGNPETISN